MITVNLDSYHNFLEECARKVCEGPTHRHHIIPKFMGGLDNVENTARLSYEDHCKAHLILAECFPKDSREYYGNMAAAHTIQNTALSGDLTYSSDKSYLKGIKRPQHAKLMRDRMLKGEHNLSFQGLSHSHETKKMMSESAKSSWTEERRSKASTERSVRLKGTGKGITNNNARTVRDTRTGKIYLSIQMLKKDLNIGQDTWTKYKLAGRFEILGTTKKQPEFKTYMNEVVR